MFLKFEMELWIASQAPPRADVVKSLKNGIVLNILGMGATVLGMQATVGALVAKALTTSSVPYYQASQSPVLALDVFLVQVLACSLILPFCMNHHLIKFAPVIISLLVLFSFFQHYLKQHCDLDFLTTTLHFTWKTYFCRAPLNVWGYCNRISNIHHVITFFRVFVSPATFMYQSLTLHNIVDSTRATGEWHPHV